MTRGGVQDVVLTRPVKMSGCVEHTDVLLSVDACEERNAVLWS